MNEFKLKQDYNKAVDTLQQDKTLLDTNKDYVLDFLKDSAIGKTARAKVRRKRKVGVSSRLKSLYLLKVLLRYYTEKDIKQLENIEDFISNLEDDKIKAVDGKPFGDQTKANIKKQVIIFLRWLHGETSKKFTDMTYWIDTTYRKKEPEILREEQFQELQEKCNTSHQRTLVTILYYGGFRISEFLQLNNEDIILVDGTIPYYKINCKSDYVSKTDIGSEKHLAFPGVYKIIEDYFKSKTTSTRPNELFFPSTYDGVRKLLKKLFSKINMKPKQPTHIFKHSCAQFLANDGWIEEKIRKHIGWAKGSEMASYYVNRSKLDNTREINKFKENATEELDAEVRRYEKEFLTLKTIYDQDKEVWNNKLDENQKQINKLTKLHKCYYELFLTLYQTNDVHFEHTKEYEQLLDSNRIIPPKNIEDRETEIENYNKRIRKINKINKKAEIIMKNLLDIHRS